MNPGEDVKEFLARTTMLGMILTYDVLLVSEPLFEKLYGVVFCRDFGPWIAGYKGYIMDVDYDLGELRELDPAGRIVKSCQVQLEVGS